MNKIFLYNTLSRKNEEFKPLKEGEVSFYQCGPTVYWTQHIGNLRAAVLGDVIRRVFEYNNYDVKYIKNYTDVGHMTSDGDEGEDKMLTTGLGVKCQKCQKIFNSGIAVTKRAFSTSIFLNNAHECPYCNYKNLVKDKSEYVVDDNFRSSPEEIAKKYIKIYEDDVRELNVKEATVAPLATAHIKEMQEMVAVLLEKGFAYATPLAIYFDISKFSSYTNLSGQNLEKNIAGEGSGEVSDPAKKNSHDFAIWFFRAGAHADALQYWPSPFNSPLVENGNGFPGWHIECSAMSKKYLGDTMDIHMGGIEHIPVHHTNEIAQSEAANGVKFVNYWLHNEHLLVNNEKMSKSAGTSYSLAEVKEKGFSPLALRYLFLSANYRSKQNFTWESLQAAQNGLESIYNKFQELKSPLSTTAKAGQGGVGEGRSVFGGEINIEYKNKFLEFINNDFNTPGALSVLQEVLKSDLPAGDKLATVLDFDQVLGLSLDKKDKILTESISDEDVSGKLFSLSYPVDIPNNVKELCKERKLSRMFKNWAESDRLRVEIEKLGYQIKDSAEGMEVFKK